MNLLLLYLGSFLLGLATDWIWTRWMKNVAANQAVYAANWSVGVYAAGLLYTLLIINLQFVPIALYLVGGWIGTYLAVRNHTPV